MSRKNKANLEYLVLPKKKKRKYPKKEWGTSTNTEASQSWNNLSKIHNDTIEL